MSRAFPSSLPLSRHRIDRDHDTRSDSAALDRLWSSDRARVLVLNRGLALASTGSDPEGWDGFGEPPANRRTELALLRPDELAEEPGDEPSGEPVSGTDGVTGAVRLYLGILLDADDRPTGAPIFAITVPDARADALVAERPGAAWVNLRLVATELDDSAAGVFTEALAMMNWHAVSSHCPRCGATTTVESGGWVRRCTVEGVELFPRTDAAVIVGIVDAEERLLLGSNALWEKNRYSLLAGFVEPGESLEAAAIREIAEESGVVIADPEYVGSQPWPFPASLMVGFMARVAEDGAAGERPDGDEIIDLRWFSREEIVDPDNGILLPGPSSIARAIIERWYGGPLLPRDTASAVALPADSAADERPVPSGSDEG
ncbi:NAD(+) diphosphatase [Herbiconiux sp. VKM Ac-1786]|uniref:NAD(+) diphosphatase n=1 Tax=Herbiconiux sp. VKM Ac-1786 TaxID=2783824 RepID=UPI00188C9E25|nr:NAD(+) diphosphatase [Herbiconiux sp. VKM Ac-1786]MBF4573967.1 NAD(+) diphosphatase [Herbiconiux sp. VKM Ac-1786]